MIGRLFHKAFLIFIFLACSGCGFTPVPLPPAGDGSITQEMREACPMLSDEVLEGFILAISGLRDNGLSEADALERWVEACNNIPPDGNFQGDVEACRECLPVLVEAVYSEPA